MKIKGKKTDPDRFAESETLTLASLPCWSHLSPEAYRARIAELIDQIEADAAAQREAAFRGITPQNLSAAVEPLRRLRDVGDASEILSIIVNT